MIRDVESKEIGDDSQPAVSGPSHMVSDPLAGLATSQLEPWQVMKMAL